MLVEGVRRNNPPYTLSRLTFYAYLNFYFDSEDVRDVDEGRRGDLGSPTVRVTGDGNPSGGPFLTS